MPSVFITCAVTGSGDTVGKSDKVPVTPEQIADDCIAAAKAGAAVVHIHVRDPLTGKGARDPDLYAEVVERVRVERHRRRAQPHRRHGWRPHVRFGRAAAAARARTAPTWSAPPSGSST